MTNYNDEYFIIEPDSEDTQMVINIHEKSSHRFYDSECLLPGAPLFFEPGFQERNQRLDITPNKTDIMFDASSFIVNDAIREEMIKYDFQGMQLYPAVFIDTDDSWDESYWYLNIWQDLDCWDREKSVYDPIEEDWDEDDTMVDQYFLDAAVLDKIPEENRLLFKMGGETHSYIFMHKTLVKFLQQNEHTGIRFFKVSEFTDGDQF